MKHPYAPNRILDTNPDGLAIIRRAEHFAATWYLCPAGVWTIGFGTTEGLMPGVRRVAVPGPITKARAERLLRRSLIQVFEPAVERCVRVMLNEHQFSALVSFCYNVGEHAFARSTLLRKLNRHDYAGAAQEFDRWVYAKGVRLPGLVKRRNAERRLFETVPPGCLLQTTLTPLEPLPPTKVRPARRSIFPGLKLRLP